MFKVPIVFIIYKRTDTAVRVFETIKKAKPLKLYLVSDGPKNETEEKTMLIFKRQIREGN